ncbi:4Fe-4S ferredoxin iron-sulfur binding domain protein [Denitrovibrio acetiphilus DSM 12809]|jgi:tetrathionate reductase subunit B|uniref:4Fe-4S ferredoxin iron-sulfur binding domain protein n=1 Tax=Denitrovibrio acetiphilus (strain DSM 12809 / NBRC 114555 / N2460) TaxID=522772 RepID=D4H4X7_DENA2|nr:4Fe-4S dicluster domain-containing protein [Denitrovibrio acetiphilus]ADD69333.1 4Fe-4S ferredoxin iron-sulfur binding domain protein [Denitrovibrio acetiphilus DSM 12809]
MSRQYAFIVDLRKCVGCGGCQVTCKQENEVPFVGFRSRVEYVDAGKYPNPVRHFVPKLCNNCDDAPCIAACPTGATFKMENGIVAVNRDTCIGCGRCAEMCPYGARYLNQNLSIKNDPAKYPNVEEVRGKSKSSLHPVDKCDFCYHRIAADIEEPTCVRNCPAHARYFGDLNDPNSKVSQLLKDNPTIKWADYFGTKPRVSYIAKDIKVFEMADELINEGE